MKTGKLVHWFSVLAMMLFLPGVALAQNSQDFGNYVVYYNAFNSDFLQPATAKTYGITRSKNEAVVNISVQKKLLGNVGEPVSAAVSGTASNLNGQVKTLSLREVREGNAIYYLGEFGVSNMETLDFNIQVKPQGADTAFTVKFRQQFYTD